MSRPRAVLGPMSAVLVVAGVLAGCANYTGTPSQRVQEWANDAGYTSQSGNTGLGATIAQDLSSLAAGLRERDLLGLRTACAAFSMDADMLYGELPTPDTTLTDELAAATNDFQQAGIDCSGATSFGSVAFSRYETFVVKGKVVYAAALSRLRSFGVG